MLGQPYNGLVLHLGVWGWWGGRYLLLEKQGYTLAMWAIVLACLQLYLNQ